MFFRWPIDSRGVFRCTALTSVKTAPSENGARVIATGHRLRAGKRFSSSGSTMTKYATRHQMASAANRTHRILARADGLHIGPVGFLERTGIRDGFHSGIRDTMKSASERFALTHFIVLQDINIHMIRMGWNRGLFSRKKSEKAEPEHGEMLINLNGGCVCAGGHRPSFLTFGAELSFGPCFALAISALSCKSERRVEG